MTTLDFITALFCQVDDHLPGIPKHPHATLWLSEIVTLGMLHARKGGGNRAFYRWWLILDSRVVIGQVWRKRLFLQALHGVVADVGSLKKPFNIKWLSPVQGV